MTAEKSIEYEYLFGFQETAQTGAMFAWGLSIFTFSSPACEHRHIIMILIFQMNKRTSLN